MKQLLGDTSEGFGCQQRDDLRLAGAVDVAIAGTRMRTTGSAVVGGRECPSKLMSGETHGAVGIATKPDDGLMSIARVSNTYCFSAASDRSSTGPEKDEERAIVAPCASLIA